MKSDAIILDPSVVMEFTRAEVEALKLMAQHHYDGECRSLVRQGGLIYGINNRFLDGEDKAQSGVLSFRDVDLLCKVCEQADAHDEETRLVGAIMHEQFTIALETMAAVQAGTKAEAEHINRRLRAKLYIPIVERAKGGTMKEFMERHKL